ncbi:M23 family metallopeptidase [Halorussus halophilus]|uniref:M23 family metallopeptidase n=1 Tax=Halorussus halophilus TaxID=2650975 RepID=UPI0013019A77|nr:M23 family metallopeptidase [Halorussus halophilus]
MTDTLRNDQPSVEQSDSLLRRLPDPTYLSLLFLLGIPGVFVPSLEWMQQFFLFGLFALWPVVRGFLPSPGSDENPTDWIQMGTQSGVRPLVSMVYIQFNPFVQAKGLLQLLGHVPILFRHRFRLPNPERFDQRVEYTLPVEGEWTVVNGGPTRDDSHSWGILTQRYAYDLVMTDEAGKSYEGDGDSPEEYYCFGEPVVAPADGVVVEASDGHRDYHRAGGWLDPRQRDLRGNWVTIEHADDEYSDLAHLREDSVEVSEGQRVERGQRIGRCGNSGNSTEPHLHFHVQDRPNFFLGMGLPVYFGDVRTSGRDGQETTHEHVYLERGQCVERAN